MTRNREIPDNWPASKSSKPGQFNGWQHTKSVSAAKRIVRPASGAPSQGSPPLASGNPPPAQLETPTVAPSPSSKWRWEFKQPLSLGWQFWAVLILLFSSGIGFTAVALLLKLPAVPNCPATFWPTASASMRLYCAQLAANKQTTENLLQAIALVDGLPEDHALRPEINRTIEQWSLDILKICEQKFQEGQLTEAIKMGKRIPAKTSAYKLVEQHIARWQRIWSQAQTIEQKVEQELRKLHWNLAFREAAQLAAVNNKYWASTKYDQIAKKIQLAREASAQLAQARDLSKSDRINDILEAIKQAEKIPRTSYAYQEAQNLIADSGKKLFKKAQDRIEERDWKGVLEIANKLPPSVKLENEKSDLIEVGNAISKAQSGTGSDLEAAIASLQKLETDRPLYNKAQQLINRWQRETEDIVRLERARTFASSGLGTDLKTAIAEAQQIPGGNPRYQEARNEIRRWTRQVETIEDQPYLDRAAQIANFGGIAPLQEAIQEASRIAPGRALYKQAQQKIAEWTDSIQRQQDQPYLDQARALANSGNLPAAVAAAQQIKSGRSLYKDAQSEIRGWQADIDGQQRIQEAYQVATPGTPEALSEAIRLAKQVPSISKSKNEARLMISRWSNQLFALAQDRSAYSISEAIAIAKRIPSGADAYEAAQEQIRSWQESLLPPPPVNQEVPLDTEPQNLSP